jgi:hypothetical protein
MSTLDKHKSLPVKYGEKIGEKKQGGQSNLINFPSFLPLDGRCHMAKGG